MSLMRKEDLKNNFSRICIWFLNCIIRSSDNFKGNHIKGLFLLIMLLLILYLMLNTQNLIKKKFKKGIVMVTNKMEINGCNKSKSDETKIIKLLITIPQTDNIKNLVNWFVFWRPTLKMVNFEWPRKDTITNIP